MQTDSNPPPGSSGRFDEFKTMSQALRPMRLMRMLLVLAVSGISAWAQTNVNDAGTNYDPTASMAAGTNTPAAGGEVRQLTLQDCIQMTLEHNLDLQIDRYNPQIAYFTLHGDYGPYDPALFLEGQHSHNEAGSQLLSGGF